LGEKNRNPRAAKSIPRMRKGGGRTLEGEFKPISEKRVCFRRSGQKKSKEMKGLSTRGVCRLEESKKEREGRHSKRMAPDPLWEPESGGIGEKNWRKLSTDRHGVGLVNTLPLKLECGKRLQGGGEES